MEQRSDGVLECCGREAPLRQVFGPTPVVPGVPGAPGVDDVSIPSEFSSAFRCRPDGRHQGVAETARL
jgi:hypothetical protein